MHRHILIRALLGSRPGGSKEYCTLKGELQSPRGRTTVYVSIFTSKEVNQVQDSRGQPGRRAANMPTHGKGIRSLCDPPEGPKDH